MKTISFFLTAILLSISTSPLLAQEKTGAIDYDSMSYATLNAKADSCIFLAKDPEAANEMFNHLLLRKECVPQNWYNGACVAASIGKNELALDRLSQGQKRNKKWYSHFLDNDKELMPLHSENRWKALSEENRRRKDKAEKDFDRPLIAELQDIVKDDQAVRYQYLYARHNSSQAAADSMLKVMATVDEKNEARLFKILDTRGWVSHKIVGESTHAFYTILIHSGLENQKKYLPMAQQALKHGDMTPSQYAHYEDRINDFEGKPQRYGTMLYQKEDGTYEVGRLVNSKKVDRWRKKAGLPPLKEYIASMQTAVGKK